MRQVRYGCATTTHAIRAAVQRSQASTAALSRELGINPKTVAKWRKRETVEDLRTDPKRPRSSVLSEAEESMAVALRRHTLLPLDDCLTRPNHPWSSEDQETVRGTVSPTNGFSRAICASVSQ